MFSQLKHNLKHSSQATLIYAQTFRSKRITIDLSGTKVVRLYNQIPLVTSNCFSLESLLFHEPSKCEECTENEPVILKSIMEEKNGDQK